MITTIFVAVALLLIFGLNFKDKSSKKRNVGGDLGDLFDFEIFKEPSQEEDTFDEEVCFEEEKPNVSVVSSVKMINKEGYDEINEKYKNFDFSRFENTEQLIKEESKISLITEEQSDNKFEFDLKTAVIYSEILKPKYQ